MTFSLRGKLGANAREKGTAKTSHAISPLKNSNTSDVRSRRRTTIFPATSTPWI